MSDFEKDQNVEDDGVRPVEKPKGGGRGPRKGVNARIAFTRKWTEEEHTSLQLWAEGEFKKLTDSKRLATTVSDIANDLFWDLCSEKMAWITGQVAESVKERQEKNAKRATDGVSDIHMLTIVRDRMAKMGLDTAQLDDQIETLANEETPVDD